MKKIQILNKRMLFVLLGILISFGLAISICKPDFPVKQISSSRLVRNGKGWEHIGENNRTIRFLEDNVRLVYKFNKLSDEHTWNYREFYISDLKGCEALDASVVFYDGEGNELARTAEHWGNGYNLVQNPVGNYKKIRISFYNYTGVSFTLEGMRLLETIPYFPKKQVCAYAILFFILYLLVMRVLKRKFPYRTIVEEALSCMDEVFVRMKIKNWKKKSLVLQGVLWTLLLLSAAWIGYRTQVGSQKIIRYLEVAILILFWLLGNCYEKYPDRKEPFKAKKFIQYTWLLSCVWLLVSDFIVVKKCQYVGILLLFGGGYLLYVLLRKDCMERFLKDFITAFFITAVFAAVYRINVINAGNWKIAEVQDIGDIFAVWKGYLSEMNLFGHSTLLFVRGQKRLSYNGIIRAGYVYGSAAILPYLLVWYGVFEQSAKYFLKKNSKDVVWFLGIVVIFLYSMLGNAL